MFVPKIGNDKIRFGINFFPEDIKCKINKNIKQNISKKNNNFKKEK